MTKINQAIKWVFIYKPLNSYQAHATLSKRILFFFRNVARRVSMLLIASTLILAGICIGRYIYPHTVYQDKIVEKTVIQDSPILAKIAKCESTNLQTKDGQTVIHVNSNNTYDQGKYQINSIWNKEATKLGYNLAIESDNEAFARYLYNTKGTEPWYSSKACWSK